MFLAHGPASYIANEVIQKKEISKLKHHEQMVVGVFSILFGILPDVDLLVLLMTSIPTFKHHEMFSHSPLFYISLWLVLFLLAKLVKKLFNSKTTKVLSDDLLSVLLKTFLISTLVHLAMDYVVSDILILYPFSLERFSLFKYHLSASLWSGYFLSAGMALEFVIVSVFLRMVIKKYMDRVKWLNIASWCVIVLTGIYFVASATFAQFTYRHTEMRDSNAEINYDIDYDGIRDPEDIDVDNDGVNNLEEADSQTIFKNALNIVESGKVAVGKQNDLLSKIEYLYGGMDSARVVLQAYYDAHLPISPVLDSYYKENYELSYTPSYKASEILYEYLVSEKDLLIYNTGSGMELSSGKIFFLINSDQEIVNLGITLDNNQLATVLEDDTRLQIHTLMEVLSKYDDISFVVQE